jgi:hypothetical protein
MPYKLRKSPNKNLYWVVTKSTGRKHSIKPLPKSRAKKQMAALYAIEKGYTLKNRRSSRNYRKYSK